MSRRRRETWAPQETLQFINLYGSVDVQKKLKSCHRNQVVYEQLSEKMKKYGFMRTAQQLRIKAKDLKKQYRDVKKSGHQLSKQNSFWKYYNLLDSILSEDHKGPKAVTSSTPAIKNNEKRAEGRKNSSQHKDQSHSNDSPRASQKLSDTSLDASTVSSSVVQTLPRRVLQRSRTNPAIGHIKTRSRRCWSLVHFSKVFLHYSKNMEKFQEIFQNHLGMERQEREKIQKEASRTRKEIKTAASQMREAILVQAEAINKVAEAINRTFRLLRRTHNMLPIPPTTTRQPEQWQLGSSTVDIS